MVNIELIDSKLLESSESINVKKENNLRINKLSKILLDLLDKKSESEFARILGVSQFSLNGWLNCKHFPSITSLKKIADYMQISIDELYQILDEEESNKKITPYSLLPYIRPSACFKQLLKYYNIYTFKYSK